MTTNRASKLKAFPLQFVLIVPFVLQIFGAVGLVGYLSFKNGQDAVKKLADQLMERTSNLVAQHLDAYLSIPHLVIQINADAVRMGLLDRRDRKTVAKYLWHQMQAYDLSYIGLQFANGESAGAARYDGKTVTIDDIVAKTPQIDHNITTYFTDNDGNPTTVSSTSAWDILNQLNYTEPVKGGKSIWLPIYTFYDPGNPPYIAAPAARPIYDYNQKVIGVAGAEIHLLKLSEFLRKLEISRSGEVFIIEPNGLLVANSGQEQPFIFENREIKRMKAIDSPNPLVKDITKQIQQHIPNLSGIKNHQKFTLNSQGESYHVHIAPWRDKYGLDWLVITCIPDSTFMEKINANTQITILLCFGALIGATAIGIFTSRWITLPILHLNQASQSMAFGQLQQTVKDCKIQEINTLADSFNRMGEQLHESFTALEKSNEDLEERVEKRTTELQNTLSELQRTQTQVIQSEKMSALGNLVAGVAHEINNPVGFLAGNIEPAKIGIKDLFELIDLYEKKFPPDAEIEDKIAEIDLEYLREDLPKLIGSMSKGVERIRDISTSLRTFSRADSDRPVPFNIHDGLDSAILILKHRLKANENRPAIEIIKNYGELPMVECYAGQLNQVFMNIIANAIDALEEGNQGRKYQEIENSPNLITITTEVDHTKKLVIIQIADNGKGMTENVQKKIFDHLFTTKGVGKGTGLGLAIANQIITEKHQGDIKVNSILGKGTEFFINIPIIAKDHKTVQSYSNPE